MLYDPLQSRDPVTNAALPPNSGIWKFYVESNAVDQQILTSTELQIWRKDTRVTQTTREILTSVNIAAQLPIGRRPNVCSGELDGSGQRRIKAVNYHAPDTSVNEHGRYFNILDGNGNAVYSNCAYTGDLYDVTTPGGRSVGSFDCDGFGVLCIKPTDNQAVKCGGGSPAGCERWNSDCAPYYQLLAVCRI